MALTKTDINWATFLMSITRLSVFPPLTTDQFYAASLLAFSL